MSSLAAEDRGNIAHKTYPAFALIKCPVYSSYKVREYMSPKNPKDFSARTLSQKHQPQITMRSCVIPNSKEKDSEQTVNRN